MKSVLVSEKPIMCDKIANGKKTIIVKKKAPKEVPFKGFIYCTQSKSDIALFMSNDEDKKFIFADYRNVYNCDVNGKVDWDMCDGKVIGEFVCNEIEELHEWELSPQGRFADFERERLAEFLTASCLSELEVVKYRENLPYYKPLYGWHISDLKIYDKPRELGEFGKFGFGHEVPLERPCAPWCYVEDLKERK